jgi:hypothetical protein
MSQDIEAAAYRAGKKAAAAARKAEQPHLEHRADGSNWKVHPWGYAFNLSHPAVQPIAAAAPIATTRPRQARGRKGIHIA